MLLAESAGLGVLVGLVLGALGGGGAIITVPVLVYLIGMSAHEATTASLVIVGVSAVIAAIGHARKGNVQFRTGVIFGSLGLIGTLTGSRISVLVTGDRLLVAFAVLLVVVAAIMLRKTAKTPPRNEAAAEATAHPAAPASPWWLVLAVATGVGLLTGFFGVGGGFVIVPALVLVLRMPMAQAVGTSLVVVTINSAVALASRLAGGISLDWPVVLAFTAGAMVAAYAGSHMSSALPARALQRAFAGLLIVVALYTFARSITGAGI
ncbi:MAG: sulfite exporter TauE/SafE family protein [Nostocoides sp.]